MLSRFEQSNLLLERPDENNDNCSVYVADFGIAKLFIESLPSRFTQSELRPRLNPRWLAPELIENQYSPRTLQSDVYAFAVTAVQVISIFSPVEPLVTFCKKLFRFLRCNCLITMFHQTGFDARF